MRIPVQEDERLRDTGYGIRDAGCGNLKKVARYSPEELTIPGTLIQEKDYLKRNILLTTRPLLILHPGFPMKAFHS